jgi:myo-inositol-1(or 4)-monophosphatase
MNLKRAEAAAVEAARLAGGLMRRHLHSGKKKAHFESQHDIKLDLDVRCQNVVEKTLRREFPEVSILGEEGMTGPANAEYRWVVDPIDGTVNFAYGIPHACVAIALQGRLSIPSGKPRLPALAGRGSANRRLFPGGGLRPIGERRHCEFADGYTNLVGVVYDPFFEEMWTAIRGGPARLNGRPIHVSRRRRLEEAVVTIGFSKTSENLRATLPYFNQMAYRVRKLRMMGSAGLALTYVATGRFDAYIESGVRLWDLAAGGLIVECAGGTFSCEPRRGAYYYRLTASNGLLDRKLRIRSRT